VSYDVLSLTTADVGRYRQRFAGRHRSVPCSRRLLRVTSIYAKRVESQRQVLHYMNARGLALWKKMREVDKYRGTDAATAAKCRLSLRRSVLGIGKPNPLALHSFHVYFTSGS